MARHKRLGLTLALALLFLFGALIVLGRSYGHPTVAHAQSSGTVRYVAPGGNCGTASPCYDSVQAAVGAANNGDEIRIAEGTYNENVNITRSVTLRGGYTTTDWSTADPEAHPALINAGGTNLAAISSRTSDITITLEGLEIAGGGYTSNQPSGGIDIYASNIHVTIRNCSIHNNYDYWGGAGIEITANGGSSVLIEDSRVYDNSSDRGGTGIALSVQGPLTVRGNRVTGNSNAGYFGSGVSLYGTSGCTIEDNVIAQNSGGSGLYIQNCLGDLRITGNRVWGNTTQAGSDAGGMSISSEGAGLIAGNVITGNTYARTPAQDDGAGAMRLSGPYIVRSNVITGNSGGHTVWASNNIVFENNVIADNAPGAGFDVMHLTPYPYADSPYTFRLIHNTIARNGDGIAIHAPAPSDPTSPIIAYITNTIIYSHGVGVEVISSSVAYVAFSILSNTTEITGNVTQQLGILTQTNPLFLADGYHLADNSPALNIGYGTDFAYADIDGQPRLMGPATDIGADEIAYTATLALDKVREGSGTARAGQPVTCTLTVTNAPTSTWTADVQVVDRITSAYPLAGLSGSGPNVSCQAGSQIITCTYHNVPTGTAVAATVVMTPAIPTVQSTQGFASADNLGVSIPDDGCGSNNYATHTLTVDGSGTIVDVDVFIENLVHTWDSDLNIYVQGPDGTQVELSTGNGGSGDNYLDTIFDDEAATSITAGSAPFSGRFRPEGSLAAFDGKEAGGNWTLRICDGAGGDIGTLNSWGLTLTLETEATEPVSWVITDTATMVALDACDPTDEDNTAGPLTVTAIYTPPHPDVWVAKVGPAVVETGHTFTYTLQWGNQGDLNAEGVMLTDTLPAEIAFQAADGSPLRDGRFLTWTLGTLSPGAGGTYVITVTVGDLPDGTTLTNTGGITTTSANDPLLNNTAIVTTTVYSQAVNLRTTKRVTPAFASIRAGQNLLTYTVEVVNIGATTAAPTIRDPVPAGTTYIPGSAQIVQGSGTVVYHSEGNYVEVAGDPLAPGQTMAMQFRVRVTSPDGEAPGRIRNRAEIRVPGYPNIWYAETESEVKNHDLGVEVRTPRQLFWQRTQTQVSIPITVTYRNAGSVAAEQPVLQVKVSGADFTGAYPPPDEQAGAGDWRWNLNALGPNTSGTVHITATATSWSPSGYNVQASITNTAVPTESASGLPNTVVTATYPFRVQTERSSRARYFISEEGPRTQYEYQFWYRYEHTDPSRPPFTSYRITSYLGGEVERIKQFLSQPRMEMAFRREGGTTVMAWSSTQSLRAGDRGWLGVQAEGPMASGSVSQTTMMTGTVAGTAITDTAEPNSYAAPPLLAPYPINLGDGEHTPGYYSVTVAANPNTTVTMRTSAGQFLGSARTDSRGLARMAVNLPEGQYDLYVTAQRGSEAITETVSVNTQDVPWDPQRSCWTGELKAGPLAGTFVTETFKAGNGRYSTTDWQIPGAYGFWDTTLYLHGSGSFCDQGNISMTVEADNVAYSPAATQTLPGGGVGFEFNVGSAHDVDICARCVEGDQIYKEKCSQGKVLIDPDGFVFDVDQGGSYDPVTGMFAPVEAISGVTVTCYVSMPEWGGWIPWPAHLYGQTNPQVTDDAYPDGITTPGYFAFFTPPGDYYLEVEGLPGYQRWRSPVIHVITQVVHVNVPYTPWPEEAAVTVTLTPDGPDPAVVTVPVGSAVEWLSSLRETDTLTDLVRWSENPILRPLSTPDPLESHRGFDAGYLKPGERYRRSFLVPGEYPYTDGAGHSGKVVVVAESRIYLPLVLRRH